MTKGWLSADLWIIGAGFIAAMHVGKLPPAVSALQIELSISLVQAGLLLSLIQGAGMVSALALGSYVEKIGLIRCVLIGLLLLSVASAVGALSHSMQALFISRIVEGFGFLLVTLSAPAYIRQLVPIEQLHAKIGLWSSYMGTGVGLSLLLAPFLIESLGWQSLWLLLALLSLLLCLVIWKWVPKASPVAKNIAITELVTSTLKHPPAWCLAFIFAMYTGQWFTLIGFLPTIYQHNMISLKVAGLLTAMVALSNAIGTSVCGLLLQRGFSSKTLVQFGFSVLLVCAFTFYTMQNQLPFMLQYALVFSFSMFGGLVAATILSQSLHFAVKPIAISATVGLILQVSAISQFLLPPAVAGIVSMTASWFWVGILMASLSAIGIVVTQYLFKAASAQ